MRWLSTVVFIRCVCFTNGGTRTSLSTYIDEAPRRFILLGQDFLVGCRMLRETNALVSLRHVCKHGMHVVTVVLVSGTKV